MVLPKNVQMNVHTYIHNTLVVVAIQIIWLPAMAVTWSRDKIFRHGATYLKNTTTYQKEGTTFLKKQCLILKTVTYLKKQ
jgi:hypothetical protein